MIFISFSIVNLYLILLLKSTRDLVWQTGISTWFMKCISLMGMQNSWPSRFRQIFSFTSTIYPWLFSFCAIEYLEQYFEQYSTSCTYNLQTKILFVSVANNSKSSNQIMLGFLYIVLNTEYCTLGHWKNRGLFSRVGTFDRLPIFVLQVGDFGECLQAPTLLNRPLICIHFYKSRNQYS